MGHLQQFYVDPINVRSSSFVLADQESLHAVRVLRKKVGDTLMAVDGQGNRYTGQIKEIGKREILVTIESHEKNSGEPVLHLTLAQAVPKGHYFDWAVEKGTEIGISAFQPILTERSIVDPSMRLDRWRHKALAAMKQCGRTVCPQIFEPKKFIDLLSERPECAFIAYEHAEHTAQNSLGEKLKNCRRAILFVGPEGGFTDEEINLALDHDVHFLSLGPRRLRSETAGLVGAVQLLTASGDLS